MSEQPSLGVRLMAQRDGWRARAKQAEAAISSVRALPESPDGNVVIPAAAEEWQNGWRWGWRYAIQAAKRALCVDPCGYPNCWHPESGCARLAALDSSGTVEDAPEEHERDWSGFVEEDDEYAARCSCGYRVTGWSEDAVEEALQVHIDESAGTHPDVPAPGRSGEEFAEDDWVLVDVGPVTQQRGQVVRVVRADDGGVWEYDVRVRDGEIVAAQPAHVHPDYTRLDSGLPVDGETT